MWEAAANLSGLDLSNNSLQQLPADGLSLCRNLRVLDLSCNRLTVWPLSPSCVLPSLQQLTLAHNPIRGPLPPHALDGVGTALRSLDLSGIAVRLPCLTSLLARVFSVLLRRRWCGSLCVRVLREDGAMMERRSAYRASGAWARLGLT